MTVQLTRERVRRDVEVLSRAGLATADFLAEVHASLQRAVPSDAACLATLDPTTSLATGAFKFGELSARTDTDELWALLEYGQVDPTSFAELARAGVGAVGMHAAMGADLDRSARVRELVRAGLGCADELRVVAADGQELWGGWALFRDTFFSGAEVEFVAGLSDLLARGLRVGLMHRLVSEPDPVSVAGPVVLVLDADARLLQVSVGAAARLAEMGGADAPLPHAVVGSLVAAAGRYARGETSTLPTSRLRLRTGEWFVLRASPLSAADGSTRSVVVTIEQASPPDVVPLVASSLGLTPRERDVTHLVLQGRSTREIAGILHLSPHTVQDHLKSVFAKADVHSRQELVARVFFSHYAGRIGGPLHPSGGPLLASADRAR